MLIHRIYTGSDAMLRLSVVFTVAFEDVICLFVSTFFKSLSQEDADGIHKVHMPPPTHDFLSAFIESNEM